LSAALLPQHPPYRKPVSDEAEQSETIESLRLKLALEAAECSLRYGIRGARYARLVHVRGPDVAAFVRSFALSAYLPRLHCTSQAPYGASLAHGSAPAVARTMGAPLAHHRPREARRTALGKPHLSVQGKGAAASPLAHVGLGYWCTKQDAAALSRSHNRSITVTSHCLAWELIARPLHRDDLHRHGGTNFDQSVTSRRGLI
jgi:hypothetical protein